MVAGDHAGAFQPAHAVGAGRGRQPDLLGQVGDGDASVALKDVQDLAVDTVELLHVGVGRQGYQAP